MKKILLVAVMMLTTVACSSFEKNMRARFERDDYKNPFYARYLSQNNPLDRQIVAKVRAINADPKSATLHNDLGVLLLQRGFPNDAEREFRRAVKLDHSFYQGWYNLGLARQNRGDETRARWAFRRTLSIRPGHSQANFQLGLMEEQRGNNEAAIDYYARAFAVNHQLLDVKVNPRIVDSRLVDMALLKLYPDVKTRKSAQPLASPAVTRSAIVTKPMPEAASPQAPAEQIVPPAPAVTEPATQTPPPLDAPPVPPQPPQPGSGG